MGILTETEGERRSQALTGETDDPPSQSSTTREWVYLASNPKSAYKQLFIKGTHIRAEVVYRLSVGREPMTAEEIAADYGLPLEAVKEAIAYGGPARRRSRPTG